MARSGRRSCTASRRARHPRPTSTSPPRCTSSCATWSSPGVVDGVHDCSDGGLAVALAEMAIARRDCGVAVVPDGEVPAPAWFFGESASRVVVAVDPVDLDDVLTRARDARIPARDAGMTGGDRA